MATDYITPAVLRTYIGDDTLLNADSVAGACTVASRLVDSYCERYFFQDLAVSDRFYRPCSPYEVETDDISTNVGLIVAADTAYDGTYGQAWTVNSDFFLEPVNPNASGSTLPFRKITALYQNAGGKYFIPNYPGYTRPYVKVTAKWGWPAVPDEIVQATKILAARYLKLSDAPFDVAGFSEFGAVRIREYSPAAEALLRPYKLCPIASA
jgi:hypothetical protein